MLDYKLTSIQCGVPQGSTLGLLLFIIFINDITEYVKDPLVTLYADDTAFLVGGDDITVMSSKINDAAMKFHGCKINRLTQNLSKCKVMLFSNKSSKQHNLMKKKLKHVVKRMAWH